MRAAYFTKIALTACGIYTYRPICTAGKPMKFATKLIQNYKTHLTLGMLLHHLGKLKIQIFCRWKITQTDCILIASNFVIHPQILIFSVLEIASLSPY